MPLFREKLADAANNGEKCESAIQSRIILLTDTNTCNDATCPTGKNSYIVAFNIFLVNAGLFLSMPSLSESLNIFSGGMVVMLKRQEAGNPQVCHKG